MKRRIDAAEWSLQAIAIAAALASSLAAFSQSPPPPAPASQPATSRATRPATAPAWPPADGQITHAALLWRTIDLARLPQPPVAGESTGVIARPTGGPGDDAPLEKTKDGWFVLAAVDGPGVITRMGFDPPTGAVRLIVDGKPAVDTTLDELLSGRMPAFPAPLVTSHTSYVPIGFATSVQVLSRSDQARCAVSFTRFAPGARVEPFRTDLDDAAMSAQAEVVRALTRGPRDAHVFAGSRPSPVAVQQDLGPEEKLTETLDGDGTLRAIYVALTDRTDPRELYALRRMVLRVFVDGEDLPAVEAPLVDFFGSGFDLELFNTLALGTDRDLRIPLPERRMGQDRFMYCFFPMPYRDGLRFEIENRNTRKKPIGLIVFLMPDAAAPAPDALRFRARARQENPARGDEYIALQTGGPGRLVGLTLLADCPRRAWWGAGAVRFARDSAAAAPLDAGVDAFFGGPAGALQLGAWPFHAVPRTGPYGKNAGVRLFIGDSLDFAKDLRLSLANEQPGGERDVYYASVAYWYAPAGDVRSDFTRLDDKALDVPGFRLPNTVEVEGNIRSKGWGNTIKEEFSGGAEFSRGIAAVISTAEPVSVVIPSDREQTVRLRLRTNPRKPFETIAVRGPDGAELATLKYDWAPDGVYDVGAVKLAAGENVFTVVCSRPAVLDCWILEAK